MTSSELGVFFIPDCVETELCPLSPTVVAIFHVCEVRAF